MSTPAYLSAQNAGVSMGKVRALSDVSLEIGAGELVGVLGPNGSGKTTLVRALLGLVPLSQGHTRIGGQLSHSLQPKERARRVAYLPQARPTAWPISVREAVTLGRYAYGVAIGPVSSLDRAAVDRALLACSIEHLADRAITELSGGEVARTHIARALAAEAPALVADEPVGALDPAHQWRVMTSIRAFADKGGAALVVLHDLALAAQFCTRLVFLRHGEVYASGSPQDTLTPETARAVYGIEAAIGTLGGLPSIAVLSASGSPLSGAASASPDH